MLKPSDRAAYINWPNGISLLRLATSPVLIFLLISPGRTLSVLAAAVFVLVSLTDWLDGYLARRMGVVTKVGKFLDPLADKAIICTALVMLIPLGRVPAWIAAMIIGRELAVTGLRLMATSSGMVIAASRLGKYKTVFQIISITALITHYRFYGVDFQSVGIFFLAVAFILTIWSGADYFVKYFRASSTKDSY